MANYHLEAKIISRSDEGSVTKCANYITGERLHDSYFSKTYYRKRGDVAYYKTMLPANAPP